MTEIIIRELTPEEIAEREVFAAGQHEREMEAVRVTRQLAYVAESDPLNFKWQETQLDADRQLWLDKKAEIIARYPFPEAPKKSK